MGVDGNSHLKRFAAQCFDIPGAVLCSSRTEKKIITDEFHPKCPCTCTGSAQPNKLETWALTNGDGNGNKSRVPLVCCGSRRYDLAKPAILTRWT